MVLLSRDGAKHYRRVRSLPTGRLFECLDQYASACRRYNQATVAEVPVLHSMFHVLSPPYSRLTLTDASQNMVSHNYGYYAGTQGASISAIAASSGVVETFRHENIWFKYKSGDRGFPCLAQGRHTSVRVRCIDQYTECLDSEDTYKKNCTNDELLNGGCVCGFAVIPPCGLRIMMLMQCGERMRQLDYAWWNVIDLSVYVVITIVILLILLRRDPDFNTGSKVQLYTHMDSVPARKLSVWNKLLKWCGWYSETDLRAMWNLQVMQEQKEILHVSRLESQVAHSIGNAKAGEDDPAGVRLRQEYA